MEAAEENIDESHTDESPFGIQLAPPSAYDAWIKSTIYDFLDIADLPTSNERHIALVAMKINFAERFKLVDAYLFVEDAYSKANKDYSKTVDAERAKVAILKRQLGI